MVVLNHGIAAVLARLPGRRARADDSWNGGSYLHWVRDGRDGLRLAGDFLPRPVPHAPVAQRTSRRRGPRRAG